MCVGYGRRWRCALFSLVLASAGVCGTAQEQQAEDFSALKGELLSNSLSIETYLSEQEAEIEHLSERSRNLTSRLERAHERARHLSGLLESSSERVNRLQRQARTQQSLIDEQEKQIGEISSSLKNEREVAQKEIRKAKWQGLAIGSAGGVALALLFCLAAGR